MTQTQAAVLVVDDDAELREALAALLHLNGFPVVTAGDGHEALEQLRQGLRPCLILLDLMMPEMDGFQFRQEQLDTPDWADIPVAVCTAVYDARQTAQNLNATAYLQKPIDIDALLTLVAAHCQKRAQGS